jgi:hypothetical protein
MGALSEVERTTPEIVLDCAFAIKAQKKTQKIHARKDGKRLRNDTCLLVIKVVGLFILLVDYLV